MFKLQSENKRIPNARPEKTIGNIEKNNLNNIILDNLTPEHEFRIGLKIKSPG